MSNRIESFNPEQAELYKQIQNFFEKPEGGSQTSGQGAENTGNSASNGEAPLSGTNELVASSSKEKEDTLSVYSENEFIDGYSKEDNLSVHSNDSSYSEKSAYGDIYKSLPPSPTPSSIPGVDDESTLRAIAQREPKNEQAFFAEGSKGDRLRRAGAFAPVASSSNNRLGETENTLTPDQLKALARDPKLLKAAASKSREDLLGSGGKEGAGYIASRPPRPEDLRNAGTDTEAQLSEKPLPRTPTEEPGSPTGPPQSRFSVDDDDPQTFQEMGIKTGSAKSTKGFFSRLLRKDQ
jgi:hypothetical protein